jgi:hypothetical protein
MTYSSPNNPLNTTTILDIVQCPRFTWHTWHFRSWLYWLLGSSDPVHGNALPPSSALKMVAVCSPKILVPIYRSTQCHTAVRTSNLKQPCLHLLENSIYSLNYTQNIVHNLQTCKYVRMHTCTCVHKKLSVKKLFFKILYKQNER